MNELRLEQRFALSFRQLATLTRRAVRIVNRYSQLFRQVPGPPAWSARTTIGRFCSRCAPKARGGRRRLGGKCGSIGGVATHVRDAKYVRSPAHKRLLDSHHELDTYPPAQI